MLGVEKNGRSGSTDTIDVAFVLLVLQAAFGFVAALGMFVLAAATHSLGLFGGALLFAVAVPSALLLCAFGVARLHRWAWYCVLGFEAIELLGALFRLLLRAYSTTSLVGLLANLVVPALIAGLLLTPSARRAIGRRTTGAGTDEPALKQAA
jgi:hypothetical protein